MILSAREETRTPTDLTPTASETAAYTNFATRAFLTIILSFDKGAKVIKLGYRGKGA